MRYITTLLLATFVASTTFCMEDAEGQKIKSVEIQLDGIAVPAAHTVEVQVDENKDLILHVDLDKLATLVHTVQNQKAVEPKSKDEETQQWLQEARYGKELAAIPLKEYQPKYKEFWAAINSSKQLEKEAYKTYENSNKYSQDLEQFVYTLKESWEYGQKAKELRFFSTKREHLSLSGFFAWA